jgi:hypothetical protein
VRRGLTSAAVALSLLSAGPAMAAPVLSTSNRLDDRRYVAAGDRAYIVGAESGRYPATGWHTRGEMGGVWSPPIKLLDGIWFGIGNDWIGPATRFDSGYGYVRMQLPGNNGVSITRTDFAPDGRRGVLVGLTLSSDNSRTLDLKVDAHSELMSAFPWGGTTPSVRDFNFKDSATFDGARIVFRDAGTPAVPNADPHDWAAAVGSTLTPDDGRTGDNFRGPQDPATICPLDGTAPPRCDDSDAGRGAGGELTYKVKLDRGSTRTVWFGVGGSETGPAGARQELSALLNDPAGELQDKIASREKLAARTKLSLPGDPRLAEGIDWSKQNLADLTQEAHNLKIRFTNQGKEYPPALGTVSKVRFLGAGFPDYPWLFATDGEYTAFAAVGVGQFDAAKDHLRALQRVSDMLNGGSGKVAHEIVTDGSVYFGANSDPGNTDETAKFPSALALIWRWTGDNAFRDQLYDFAKRNMQYVVNQLDADGDGWPEGSGNVEREGMGEEKLDNTVYAIRGLRDLAAMAQSKGDSATQSWAESHASAMETAFESAWWVAGVPQYADSLDDPGDVKLMQRYWIGVTPMEAELYRGGEPVPGLAAADHANAALDVRERPCYGDDFGLFHTGASGCDNGPAGAGEKQTFTLNTAVMAVGEGNYGRLGSAQQERFTTANRRLQLPTPDEQPGAMPEIAPSPAYGRSVDKAFYDRAMVMQAWGSYGTVWPVVHQQLGVRPDLGNGKLEVTPQVPPGSPGIGGKNIRLGSGSIDVSASAAKGTYTTVVSPHLSADLTIGHTLPAGATVGSVKLNGSDATYTVRDTNRGREVLVHASGTGQQKLVITAT